MSRCKLAQITSLLLLTHQVVSKQAQQLFPIQTSWSLSSKPDVGFERWPRKTRIKAIPDCSSSPQMIIRGAHDEEDAGLDKAKLHWLGVCCFKLGHCEKNYFVIFARSLNYLSVMLYILSCALPILLFFCSLAKHFSLFIFNFNRVWCKLIQNNLERDALMKETGVTKPTTFQSHQHATATAPKSAEVS